MKTLEEILRSEEQVNGLPAPETDADGVINLLCEQQLEAVLVLEDEKLAGVLCAGDSFRKVTLAKTSFDEPRLRQIILRNIIATSPELIANKCQKLTRENRVDHLPVVFDERLLGIVSLEDLAKVVL